MAANTNTLAIKPEATLFAITEAYPETIDVFVANGNFSEVVGQMDISAQSQYLAAGTQWYLEMADLLGANDGFIQTFQIVLDDGTIFAAGNLPVFVPDFTTG